MTKDGFESGRPTNGAEAAEAPTETPKPQEVALRYGLPSGEEPSEVERSFIRNLAATAKAFEATDWDETTLPTTFARVKRVFTSLEEEHAWRETFERRLDNPDESILTSDEASTIITRLEAALAEASPTTWSDIYTRDFADQLGRAMGLSTVVGFIVRQAEKKACTTLELRSNTELRSVIYSQTDELTADSDAVIAVIEALLSAENLKQLLETIGTDSEHISALQEGLTNRGKDANEEPTYTIWNQAERIKQVVEGALATAPEQRLAAFDDSAELITSALGLRDIARRLVITSITET